MSMERVLLFISYDNLLRFYHFVGIRFPIIFSITRKSGDEIPVEILEHDKTINQDRVRYQDQNHRDCRKSQA